MSSSLRIWPVGQIQRESITFDTSPFVANTAQSAQNGQNSTNACLFSRHLLHSARSSQIDPLASLTHSWRSVPDRQPQVAESRDSGRNGQNLADRSPFGHAIGPVGRSSRAVSRETAHVPIAVLIESGQYNQQSPISGSAPVCRWGGRPIAVLIGFGARSGILSSPLVAKTAKNTQERQNYRNACLFSRHFLRSAVLSCSSPFASLAHSGQPVPGCPPRR